MTLLVPAKVLGSKTLIPSANALCCILYYKLWFLCIWECLIINKKHFLATQNTKCGYPAKIRKCAGARNDLEFNFHFHMHKLEADY